MKLELKKYFVNRKISIILLIFLNAINVILTLWYPIRISHLIKNIMENKYLSITYMVQTIVLLLFLIANNMIAVYLTKQEVDRFEYYVKESKFKELIYADYSLFQKVDIDSYIQILHKEIKSLSIFTLQDRPSFYYNIILSIGVLIIVRDLGGLIFLIFLAATIAYHVLLSLILRNMKERKRTLIECQNDYFGRMLKIFDDTRTVKIFVIYNKIYNVFKDKTISMLDSFIKVVTITIGANALLQITKYSIMIGCLFYVVHDKRLHISTYILLQQYINYYISSLDNIGKYKEKKVENIVILQKLNEYELSSKMMGTQIISKIEKLEIKNLNFSYSANTLFHSLCYEFQTGKCYVLKGENGTGKSTFYDLLMGLLRAHKGEILYNDVNIQDINTIELRNKYICLMGQNSYLLEDDIKKNVSYNNHYITTEKIEYYIRLFGIQSMDDRKMEQDLNVSLSGGQIQKVALIRSLVKLEELDAGLMLFDEPTNTLDGDSIHTLRGLISTIKLDRIVMIITHENVFDDIADEILTFDKMEEKSHV